MWAIDLETRGTDASLPDSAIVGIGFADDDGCFYIDLRALDPEVLSYIWEYLGAVKLTAFNVMFDGTFLQVATGKWLDWFGCSYGLFKQLSSEGHTGQRWNLDTAISDVLGWSVSTKKVFAEVLKERGLSKGEMWKVEAPILGVYSSGDADAGWQLWKYLSKVCQDFPFLMEYHQREFLTEVMLLAEQQIRGMYVDRPRLQIYHDLLATRIQEAMEGFLNHGLVAPHIAEYNENIRQQWVAKEPPRTNKNGSESVRWDKWKEHEHKLVQFNPNSKQQLEILLFDKIGNKATKFTEGGRRAVDKKILPSLGEPGQLLNKYNLLVKERSYVAVALEKSARDGLIHPQFNSVGTITGRLGGSGGFNLQQQPKTQGYLECLQARPGNKLIQIDAEALEPTILCEFSQDKALLSLYGPDAKPSDVYLFVASKIPALGAEIIKYFDPDNPTPEGIAAAKKHCKRDRAIAKVVVLSANYLAGPAKIHETLTLGGIDISLYEVRKIHQQYWKLFAGVQRWQSKLKMIWANNGGWIPSLSGRPMCVAERLLKDCNSRFCQTSGHDVLQLLIWNVHRLRQERNLEFYPWLIDLHDELIVEAKQEIAGEVEMLLIDALAATNKELNMGVSIRGIPMIVDSLAQIKVGG